MTQTQTGQFSFDDQLNINVVASKATEQPQAEKQQRLDLDGKAQAWTDATNATTAKTSTVDKSVSAIEELFGPVISTYTRAQAIEDGVLIDVSSVAQEAGIRYPVAVTARVWHDYVTPDPRAAGYQDQDGRLWDILWLLSHAARNSQESVIQFRVSTIMKARQRRWVMFKALCGPGDTIEPVVTIMMPDEDQS